MARIVVLWAFVASLSAPLLAQVPTGSVAGAVTDQVGGVLPNATVTVTNRGTGAARVVHTDSIGNFSMPSLVAGSYDVVVVAIGFQSISTAAEVVTGSTTTIKVVLGLGARKEYVEVTGITTSVDLASNRVQGVVDRNQIENLPLNGRSFMNLSALQPGVTVALGSQGQANAQFNVSLLGAPASRTAITIDGGNVRSSVDGGPAQNFSQEIVQEFQISTVNFDLSTGIAAFGAINVVTRSGTNELRGSGYLYYRDESLASYPSLVRTTLTDNPEFSRKQAGFVLGGPIKRDKVHFFASYELTDQRGIYVVQPDLPSVAGFSTLAPAPFNSHQVSARTDFRLKDQHTLFARYSYEHNSFSGPFAAPVPPSNFVFNQNEAHQALIGITSVLSPTLVNEFRFSYMYGKNRNIPAPCEGDINGNCIGAGGPEIFMLDSVNFQPGNSYNSPQGRDIPRFPISNHTTWLRGSHSVKFGGTFEPTDLTGYWEFFDPARVYLLSPEFLAGLDPALPAQFGLPDGKSHHQAYLLRLPVVTFILGIGDRSQPSYPRDEARHNNRYHLYVQDSWQATPSVTLNVGLGWQHESNLLNHDLAKPAYLAPIYGSDLSPTEKRFKNFSPAAGFAWSVGREKPTVIRGGAGIFYDTQLGWWRLGERAVIGGSGRQFIFNNAVINPLTGEPFTSAYLNALQLPYGDFLEMLPGLRAQQDAKYPGTGDQPQILLSKQANALGAMSPREFPTTSAHHFNLGFQREMGGDIVLQADVVYRKMLHGITGGFVSASVDFNKFDSIAGPVIPRCTAAQADDPAAQCSSGAMNFWWPGATAEYKGLLVKATKRMSHRYMLSGSYALQFSDSIGDITQNLDDYFATYGPDLPRHNLTVSALFDLPWDVEISVLSTYLSRPPVAPYIAGVNNPGTDITSNGYTPLLAVLGRGYSDFLSNSELDKLVQEYNTRIAGTLTPAGAGGAVPNQRYPVLSLPTDYQLGDAFSSQDVRFTKSIKIAGETQVR